MRERTHWDVCIYEELVKACVEGCVNCGGAPADDGNKDDDIQTDIGEDVQAASGDPEVVGAGAEA